VAGGRAGGEEGTGTQCRAEAEPEGGQGRAEQRGWHELQVQGGVQSGRRTRLSCASWGCCGLAAGPQARKQLGSLASPSHGLRSAASGLSSEMSRRASAQLSQAWQDDAPDAPLAGGGQGRDWDSCDGAEGFGRISMHMCACVCTQPPSCHPLGTEQQGSGSP